MGERTLIHPRVAEFRSRWAGMSPVELGFRSQMDTLRGFLAGKGDPKVNHLEMTIKGANDRTRKEIWHRHEPGFADGVKVVSIGAHPDDTALDAGLSYLLVKQGRINGEKKVRHAVITATPGQEGIKPHRVKGDLKDTRIEEDINGTKRLGADFYINLGFTDGDLYKESEELTESLYQYLQHLQADIVVLPDPSDLSHYDHENVTKAALKALSKLESENKLQQKPIVVFADYQDGDGKITEDHIGFSLNEAENETVRTAFVEDHNSQTKGLHPTGRLLVEDNIAKVVARSRNHAQKYADHIPPEVRYLGLARQNFDPTFSQVPISKYLEDRVIKILPHKEKELDYETRFMNQWLAKELNTFSYFTGSDVKSQLPAITDSMTRLMADATGWSREECLPRVKHRAEDFDVVIAAKDFDSGKLLSMGGYVVYEVPGLGKVLYESVKMTAKEAQGKGLGRKITAKAHALVQPDWFALRTQNPAEIASIQNTFKGSHFAPFDVDYHANLDLQAMLRFMQEELGVQTFDSRTSLIEGFYGESLGDYEVKIDHPQINTIQQHLTRLELNRERGDAILMVGRVADRDGTLGIKSSGTIFTANV